MNDVVTIVAIVLVAIAINVPLGWWRQRFARLSVGWFVCIHLSVPVLVWLRIRSGFGLAIIPLPLAGAVAGQLLGGRLFRGRSPGPGPRDRGDDAGNPE